MPPAAATSAPLALIHGDDDFAVKQRARQIYQQWCAELGGMDHETIDAQVTNSGEASRALALLRESLQTLPFFGSGKAVWLQNCSFLGDDRTSTSQEVTENLVSLAQELKEFSWQNVRLLISAGKVDRRKTFYKTVEKLGAVEAFAALSLEDRDWAGKAETIVLREVRARKKQIADDALGEVVQNIGPNSQQLITEVEKLCLYAGDSAEVTLEQVQAIVTRNKQARAFAVADALGERNLPALLRRLDEELWSMQFDKQKTIIGLLYGIISKVRTMILSREMIREGWIRAGASGGALKTALARVPADQVPAEKRFNPLALHPFVLEKAIKHAANFTLDELLEAMELLLACNQKLISSQLDDALVLQQTLVQIVRRPAPPGGKPGR
jgi:DNA polymerase-3 subunit delta